MSAYVGQIGEAQEARAKELDDRRLSIAALGIDWPSPHCEGDASSKEGGQTRPQSAAKRQAAKSLAKAKGKSKAKARSGASKVIHAGIRQ